MFLPIGNAEVDGRSELWFQPSLLELEPILLNIGPSCYVLCQTKWPRWYWFLRHIYAFTHFNAWL